MTEAGGTTLPGEVAGVVALDEVVLHGWDLARATGQEFMCDPASAEAVLGFTERSAQPDQAAMRTGLFGPVVPVADDAPVFDRALGFAGRDPAWLDSSHAERPAARGSRNATPRPPGAGHHGGCRPSGVSTGW